MRFLSPPQLRMVSLAALAALTIAAQVACQGTIEVPTDEPEGTVLPVEPASGEPSATPTPDGQPDGTEPEEEPDGTSPATPAPGTPTPDVGPGQEPDAPPASCVQWQDCGIGDSNTNGYDCVGQLCSCDPAGTYSTNCAQLDGQWDANACACLFDPIEVGGACTVWQDCPPGLDSTQSGFDCVSGQCSCDPAGTYSTNCGQQGGYWVEEECFCVFSDTPPPSQTPNPGGFAGDDPPICWWHHEQPPCDPDRYVDTSHYEERCAYDANDVWQCTQEWVQEGHYEPGACPPPIWDLRCL